VQNLTKETETLEDMTAVRAYMYSQMRLQHVGRGEMSVKIELVKIVAEEERRRVERRLKRF
jgi:hypothetical protein